MSATVTGAAYVEAMSRDPRDAEYRRTFQQLALSLAPRRGVFDFGSGPGIDARHYAEAGLRVDAYDVDAGMCDYFTRHCAAEIARGAIRLHTGTYAEFLDGAHTVREVDLVVSNFAPLNLVDEPSALFARFASMLCAGGQVLASVLNPYFHLAKKPRAWARLPRLLWQGRYTTLLHGVTPVTRWLPGRLALEARPHFDLMAVYAPRSTDDGPDLKQVRLLEPADWQWIVGTEFLFLQFRRNGRA